MATPERRITPRFKLQTPLSFHRTEECSGSEQQAKAINIAASGVYFATSLAMSVGEFIEVLIELPRRVTGLQAICRRFTGRVTHIEGEGMPQGLSRIGVLFLYYEVSAGTHSSTFGRMASAAGSAETGRKV